MAESFLQWLGKRYALSRQGAKDLVKGCLSCFLQNLALMAPVAVLYRLVTAMMQGEHWMAESPLYALMCFGCVAALAAATWVQYHATYFATYQESGVRRITLAEKLRKLPLSYFGQRDLADLTSVLMADSAFLETAFSHFIPELAGSIASTTLVALCLIGVQWKMALAALWVLPVSFLIVGCSARVQEALNQRQMDAKMACAGGIQECIETIQDLRANGAENSYLAGLKEKIHAVERRAIASELGTAVFVVSASLVLKLGIVTVAITGASLLVAGEIGLVEFFLFLLVVSRLYDPLQGALQNLAAVISARVNIGRLREILDYPVQTGEKVLTNQGYDLVFDRVSFAYDTGVQVPKDVSFTARQGEVTALVGPSGSGKTTAARLAARFWDIPQGKITLGGMDISQVDPETLLSCYAIVFQEVTLFQNTILENIRVGRKDASDEEVIAAACLAHCDEFALRMPEGWHTMIGENGNTLSGGERQRISIARAILKDAPIILLDEATASLDVKNENLVQNALSRLMTGKTVLVIAHRMRTVEGADQVVVLQDGQVTENGTPEELKEKNGLFAQMVHRQREGENWRME